MTGGGLSRAVATALSELRFDYAPSLQTQHLLLFATMTLVTVGLAYWITRTRQTRGAHLFALTLVVLGARLASDVAHGLVGELWPVLEVLVALNPLLELGLVVLFVRFAGRYAGVERVRSDRARRAMGGLVAVAAIAIATNPVHGLVFDAVRQVSIPFTHVVVERGVLGFGLLGVNAVLLLAAAGLLAYAVTTGFRPAWWPAIVLSIAVSVAIVVIALQLRVGGALYQYDYTAIGYAGFFFLTTLALVEHGLRRIEVVAREEILDDIDDAVVLLDTDGTVVTTNAAAEGLFGTLDGAEGFLDRFDELGSEQLDGDRERTAITIDPETTEWDTLRNTTRTAGRGPRHFLVSTEYVTTQTTRVIGHVVRFVETTELERRSRELERKNDQLDQFASTVSHDLRNPLNVATGYLQMATEAVDPDDDAAFDVAAALTYLDKVEVSLDRMATIIDDILALIDNADPVTDTEPVDFDSVASAAWSTVDTRSATLERSGEGTIEADETRLQRLLENLFRNAVDHVGDEVTIEVGLTGDGFYVADDGPGIPEDEREQIFEHGYTTGDEGTGLGLSIVQQLAEAHGWTVSLDPDADGAKFVVEGCATTRRPVQTTESTEPERRHRPERER
ncbi:sensor histidine kinase [Halomicrobium sp. LC1Hm]|uniref:sensor histidine kinase n=1 Tax=Halomicrobium sp. LC1Hm TaxID=2610902 RepID=UPI0012982647|nr:sensor histidine kinase [Halomicrobium sp. LC1Hm]QGA84011.1 Signal transduction histidine kinase, contains PAS domain [Halomicrobium sp. LC1Hm]